jgi:hypothetical protein
LQQPQENGVTRRRTTVRSETDEVQGVAFPLVEGSRSTTATGKAVFADAARAVDTALADEIAAEPDWYRRYIDHMRSLLAAELRSVPDPLRVPAAGLASLHDRFVFVRGQETVPLRSALDRYTEPRLGTVVVRGDSGDRPDRLTVPYRGAALSGDALHRQLDAWVEAGVAEPSFADAIRLVMDNPEWLDLSDRTFVVFGAGAEMGPLRALCAWNAEVVAVDRPVASLWQRIVAAARAGSGRVRVPVRWTVSADASDVDVAEAAGVDLVTGMPEAATWLAEVDGPVTVGNYVYADGADNVRVSMACDTLIAHLVENGDDVSLAALATPTDVYAVPEEVVEFSRQRFSQRGSAARALNAVSRGRLMAANYEESMAASDGRRFGVADCLVLQQGPNYVLAKRLHRWRARDARGRGLVSSINVAPATGTRSVMKNRLLAAAYSGAHRFGVEVFDPPTSSTLMAALLVHDLRNPKSSAQPNAPLGHPLELFVQGANHGGLWRIPWAPRAALGLAVALGLPRRRR